MLLLSRFSCVWLFATSQMAAHQAPPSLGFSRQEHWSGLPFPSPMHESEKWKVKVKSLSRVRLFSTPWTAALQAPPTPLPSLVLTHMVPQVGNYQQLSFAYQVQLVSSFCQGDRFIFSQIPFFLSFLVAFACNFRLKLRFCFCNLFWTFRLGWSF